MTEAKKRTKPASDDVYNAILSKIMTGDLQRGAAVPIASLADDLGVSRTPVREAIQRLVYDGLLSQDINHKPIFRDATASDVKEIFSMRMLLEGQSAFEAATVMDQMSLLKLEEMGFELQNSAERDEDWLIMWADYDDFFHETIAECSQNSRLIADIRRHRLCHRVLNLRLLEPKAIQIALKEHLDILAALKDRDGEKARQLMRHHIREWRSYFICNYPKFA